MNIRELLYKRYATKSFDPAKKISEDHISQLATLLQMSPSSVNLQPWYFILATTEEGKKRIAKSTEAFPFNTQKILNAAAVVVFCTRTDLSDAYLSHLLDQEEKDGRFPETQHKDQQRGVRDAFAKVHRDTLKDATPWAEKQVYLNLGYFVMGATVLGLDSLIMEGIDFPVIDQEFDLQAKGFTATVVVSLGYHSADDFNKSLPKSRLPQSEIIQQI